MIKVSKSPLRFFQSMSMGRRFKEGYRRGQICLSPEFPRYCQKRTMTHRRINFQDPMRRFY